MAEIKKLLGKRMESKKKKPVFTRRNSRYKSRIKTRWRKPRGKHSPVRRKKKGKQELVASGYGSPSLVRHLHSSGLKKIIVETMKNIEEVDPETEGIIISRTVGNKKRAALLQFAIEKSISVLNIKDPKQFIENIEKKFQERKKAKEEKKQKRVKKKEKKKEDKEKKEKAAEKEGAADTQKEEPGKEKAPLEKRLGDEKDKQKKEIEKTLIKRQ